MNESLLLTLSLCMPTFIQTSRSPALTHQPNRRQIKMQQMRSPSTSTRICNPPIWHAWPYWERPMMSKLSVYSDDDAAMLGTTQLTIGSATDKKISTEKSIFLGNEINKLPPRHSFSPAFSKTKRILCIRFVSQPCDRL